MRTEMSKQIILSPLPLIRSNYDADKTWDLKYAKLFRLQFLHKIFEKYTFFFPLWEKRERRLTTSIQ